MRPTKKFLDLASQRLKTEQAKAGGELEVRKKEVEALVKPDWCCVGEVQQICAGDREGSRRGLRISHNTSSRDDTGPAASA